MKRLKKVRQMYTLFSVGLFFLGAMLLIWPNMAADVFFKIIGVLLVLFGIVKLVGYFSPDSMELAFQFDFAMGIASALLGLVMLFRTNQLLDIVVIAIGLFMILDALLRVQTALDARRMGIRRWRMLLIMALLTAACGVLLFMKPTQATGALVMLVGLNLMIDGLLNLFVVQCTVSTFRR